jgi:hypothetical protein
MWARVYQEHTMIWPVSGDGSGGAGGEAAVYEDDLAGDVGGGVGG